MTEAAASDSPGGRTGGIRLRGPSRLLSDERLARRAAAGERAAFEEIFRRYHQDLYRFCLATAGNAQDAQDALQNTMVKVLRALPGEERRIKLKPWLYRIARNESIETTRRRRPGSELDTEGIVAPGEIADTAAARERLRGLLSDLGELPERQRAALVMREMSGLGFEEIGEAFATTPSVARQTLYEARLSLRQMEEGREMSCEKVMRTLSDADGRITRRRDLRAHLRSCSDCRSFRDGIGQRRGELAAIAPLPLGVSAGLVQGVLGGQAGAAAGAAGGASVAASAGAGAGGASGLASAIGAGAAKVAATSAVVKSAATVAVVTVVGVSAAERRDLIDLPLPDSSHKSSKAPASSSTAGQNGEVAGAEPAPTKRASSANAPAARPGATGNGVARSRSSGERNRRPAHAGRPDRPTAARDAGGGSPGAANRGKARGVQGGPPQGSPPANGRGQGPAAAGKRPAAGPPPGRTREPAPKATPPSQPPKPAPAARGQGAPAAPAPEIAPPATDVKPTETEDAVEPPAVAPQP